MDMIVNTAMCQQSDTAECNVIWNSGDSHKVPLN